MIENPLQKERTAEQKWFFVVLQPTVSKLFRSDISINKFAANWKLYPDRDISKAGLSDIESVLEGFLRWWAGRKSEIAALQSDAVFQNDLRLFLVEKIWQAKLEDDFFGNPEYRAIVGLKLTYDQFRSSVHEAVNRRYKLYGDENAKAENKKFREELDADLSKRFLANMRLVLPHLIPLLDSAKPPQLESEDSSENAA